MADAAATRRWRPTLTHLVAGTMVLGGFLLAGVSWWFLLLSALGALGPGIAREFGWLRDKDEFQRRADHRAGYHAFLAAGLVAFVLVAFFRSAERDVEHLDRLPTLLLAILWFTWLVSSLLAFWGPQKGAARFLYGFGCVWMLFAILSNVGSEWTGWAALLLHPLLAAPFFVLGWLAGRRPRVAGVLLLAATGGLFLLFGGLEPRGPGGITQWVTYTLFLGPLLASGIALLAMDRDELDDLSEESQR
jgi:hypothetical protein